MGRIVLEQVTKSFGDTQVIPPLDLTIEDGEFAVFVGPSGCGKSTLLRLIAGLEETTSGKVLIDDQDMTEISPSKRGLSMVFQSYALYPHMTVRKNIAFPLRMAKMSQDEINRRVEGAASVLNLTDYLDRRPGQLSGGQRQRLGLARALYGDPVILVLDEPNANLDVEGSNALNVAIEQVKKAGGSVIIMAHRPAAIARCEMLLLLDQGQVKDFGPRDEVLKKNLKNYEQVAGGLNAPADKPALPAGEKPMATSKQPNAPAKEPVRRVMPMTPVKSGTPKAGATGTTQTMTPVRASSAPPTNAKAEAAPALKPKDPAQAPQDAKQSEQKS